MRSPLLSWKEKLALRMSESLHPMTSPPVTSRSVVLTQPQSAVLPSVSVAWFKILKLSPRSSSSSSFKYQNLRFSKAKEETYGLPLLLLFLLLLLSTLGIMPSASMSVLLAE